MRRFPRDPYFNYACPRFLGIAEGPACNIRNHHSQRQNKGDIQAGDLIFAMSNFGYLLNIPSSCDLESRKDEATWLFEATIKQLAYVLTIY